MIKSSHAAKYLGIYLDKDLRMTTHVKKAAEKALRKQAALLKLMPRVVGPSHGKRKLLATVVQSVLLYGAPAWKVVLKYNKYVKLIRSVERKMAIKVTSAYRTVAIDAVGAISGCPPYDLLAWERARNWEMRGLRRKEVREEMMENCKRDGGNIRGEPELLSPT